MNPDLSLRRATRAYVGALSAAATLLALGIATVALAAPAEATTLPAAATPTEPSAVVLPHTPAALGAHTLVLGPGAGYEGGGSTLVRDLQRLLAEAGYRPGRIDGRYGPMTQQAVSRFQSDRGLEVDGIAGPQTLTALTTGAVATYPRTHNEPRGGSSLVRALQRHLARAGYPPGPIDGRYGPLTDRAIRRYQADNGLPVNGIAGRETLAALGVATQARSIGAHVRGLGRLYHAVARHLASPAVSRNIERTTHPASSTLRALAVVGLLGLLLTAMLYAGRRRRVRFTPAMVASYAGRLRRVRFAPATVASYADRLRTVRFAPATVASYADRLRRVRFAPAMATPKHGNQPAAVERNAHRGQQHRGAHGALKRNAEPRRPGVPAPSRDVIWEAPGTGAFKLGVLFEELGDLAGAEAAYRRADKRGHGAAACNLGVLLEGRGNPADAQQAYRRADERGDANGAFNLGVLLEEQGDPGGAEAAYRSADGYGHGAAASNLGVLLERMGNPVGAEQAYRRAVERGEAIGAFNLGVLLEEQGDLAGAKVAYRRADACGQAKVGQMARAALLDLGESAPAGHHGASRA